MGPPASCRCTWPTASSPCAQPTPDAVRSSDDVIAITEQCLRKLLADAVAGLLGAPPSTVSRELDGPAPHFDDLPDQINEPTLKIPTGSSKKPAAGIVIVDENGCLTIVEPRNHFGGYSHTYPKGHARLDRETLQQAAHREVFEETGLRARVLAVVGDFLGDTALTVARARKLLRRGGAEAFDIVQ